jgi:two-component system CheB/CheR fusion protein
MNELRPDWAEEMVGSTKDDTVPTRGYTLLPTVGLGGSAGSTAALQAFLAAVPADSGMAFIAVLHLTAEHEAALAETLQRTTVLRVVKVKEACDIEANHVYVVPSGHAVRMAGQRIRLDPADSERGQHVAVDLFFRTLAEWFGPHATAIVLSGADGDGAIGIKRIKERGGLTIAQDPDEAEVGSMPRAAIATGMVDWVLPAAQMPGRLVDYLRLERRLELPPEEGPQPVEAPPATTDVSEAALREILAYLRSRTGRDFSYYKRATIVRRIARRMQVNGIDELPAYLGCLRMHPGEAGALLQDLLISVTNFFRDSECFDALEACIPKLFEGKGPSDRLRVWVAACATGEEAYSLAMLLQEHADTLESPPLIQIFATDLDEQAIQTARYGMYPASIQTDVSADRLRRFFVKEHMGYRVRREVREMVLFAVHDLLKDSSFSRLDLVTCRNLMIYLTREAQERVTQTFHFALRAEGLLFLGSSETLEEGSRLFGVRDKKHRIYLQRPMARAEIAVPSGPGSLTLWARGQVQAREHPVAVAGAAFQALTTRAAAQRPSDVGAASWPQFHYQLLERIGPPSLVIDTNHDIVHLSPSAGQFLHLSGGEPTSNLLRLVHPSLRIELRVAIFQAAQSGAMAETPATMVEVGGETRRLTIKVAPISETGADFFLVMIEGQRPAQALEALPPPADAAGRNPIAEQLDREVERLKSHLRDTVEQYEASNEELKASNEELQAMNEELRSATEELETGREELQSINEELSTVNHELKAKVDELGSSNSDMLNLMHATAIPTVFLDRDLRITRYTPAAMAVFNLIPTDIGRPLTDLRTELDYKELASDASPAWC